MLRTYLFDKASELKESFKKLFMTKKRLRALENYSEVAPLRSHDQKSFDLIKHCLEDGFPGNEEIRFLDHLLSKYELNFLDWSHRTKWLKQEMKRLAYQNRGAFEQQLKLFNYREPRAIVPKIPPIPLDILAALEKGQISRRV